MTNRIFPSNPRQPQILRAKLLEWIIDIEGQIHCVANELEEPGALRASISEGDANEVITLLRSAAFDLMNALRETQPDHCPDFIDAKLAVA
jgi:hypothetical protein